MSAILYVCAFALLLMTSTDVSVCAQNTTTDEGAKPARFEVASIRLIPEKDLAPLLGSPYSPPGAGQFTAREVTLPQLISFAFGLDQDRLSGGPDWINQ